MYFFNFSFKIFMLLGGSNPASIDDDPNIFELVCSILS